MSVGRQVTSLHVYAHIDLHPYTYMCMQTLMLQIFAMNMKRRGGGLGSRPKKMCGERLGDGVEYHLMSPTPRR